MTCEDCVKKNEYHCQDCSVNDPRRDGFDENGEEICWNEHDEDKDD